MVRNAYLNKRKVMAVQTQQQYLNAVKASLIKLIGSKITWDEFARLCGIEPRAFKTYRMPEDSDDYRSMNNLARQAVDRVLADHQKKLKKRSHK